METADYHDSARTYARRAYTFAAHFGSGLSVPALIPTRWRLCKRGLICRHRP